MRLRPIFIAVSVVLLDCAALDKLTPGTCGNRVVDPNEDCDEAGDPDAGGAATRRCGQAIEGTTLGCHFVCASAAQCPDGWGCSVDGICRAPSGMFEPAGEPFSAGVQTLFSGDFDGDMRKDILGTGDLSGDNASKARVHFLGAGAAPSAIVSLPGLLTSPFVFEFDGDRRDDIAFGFNVRYANIGGFGLLLGQKDRTFLPRMFPSFSQAKLRATAVLIDSKPLPGGATAAPPIVAVSEEDRNGAVVQFVSVIDPNPSTVFNAPLGQGKLVGKPLFGRVFPQDATSACGEIVLAQRTLGGGLRIGIYTPCRPGALGPAWNLDDTPTFETTIPNADEKTAGILLADVDGDGDLDILVGGFSSLLLLESNGGATQPLKSFRAPAPFPLVDGVNELPLAAGDLDGDGLLEYVLPSGIAFRVFGDGGPGTRWARIPPPTKRWTQAIVARTNADLHFDVVGSSSEEPDIDIMEGTGGLPFMPSFHIPTSGPIRDLALADMDFDGVADLVFVETQSSSAEGTLAICYGRTTFPPESPRAVGRLEGMKQVIPTGLGVAVSSEKITDNALPDFSLAAAFASTERQPLAPLIFNEEGDLPSRLGEYEWQAKAVAAAPFLDAARTDLLAIAIGYRDFAGNNLGPPVQGIWAAAGTVDRSFDPARELVAIDQVKLIDRDNESLRVALATGNLDGDSRAEAVAFANAPDAGQAVLVIYRFGAGAGAPGLAMMPGIAVPAGARAELVDVDLDGDLDLVAVLVHEGRTRLLAFFNEGKLGQPFSTTPVVVSGAIDRPVRSFAALTTSGVLAGGGGQVRRDLVLVTGSSVHRATLLDDRRSFAVEDITKLFGNVTDFKTGSGVTTGDFDGDGVPDIAIAEGGSIRVARQKPLGGK